MLLGLPLLAGFVYCLTLALRMVGIKAEDPAWKWIVIVEFGLLPIPALMVIGTMLSSNPDAVKVAVSLLGGCFAVCFGVAAVCARFLARRNGDEFEKEFCVRIGP